MQPNCAMATCPDAQSFERKSHAHTGNGLAGMAFLVAAAPMLSACYTASGAGEDLSAAEHGIEHATEKTLTANSKRRQSMDKDRVEGAAHQMKGAVKEAVGKVTGDTETETEGAAEKAAGRVQNAVGGLKDAARESLKK